MHKYNPPPARTPTFSKKSDRPLSQKEVVRDEQFWFDDGSIVLQVEKRLFKVHRSILSAHSEIFADMFNMAQPAGQPLFEGCSLIELADTAFDFVDLLKALYIPLYFDTFPLHSTLIDTINFVSGILSLSTKYFILPFRRRCITLLERIIPTTLDAFDSRSTLIDGAFRNSFCAEDPNAISRAIALAHRNNLPQFLPSLYYVVSCRISPGKMLDRDSIDMSWEERTLCLVGREMLRLLEKLVSHRFVYDFRPLPSCKSSRCTQSSGPLRQWRLLESRDSPAPLTPFRNWDEVDVCPKCTLHIQEQHTAGREAVWTRLPSAFNMLSWDILTKIQDV